MPRPLSPDLSDFLATPWGVAAIVCGLILPRFLLRLRHPAGVRILGARRLMVGYLGAVVLAVACVAVAPSLGVRGWVESVPLRSAVELMASSWVMTYVLAALVALLVAAYLVAPLSAWLITCSRASGLWLAAASLPAAFIVGAISWVLWRDVSRPMLFVLASSVTLVMAVAIGFSLGAKLPMGLRWSKSSAS